MEKRRLYLIDRGLQYGFLTHWILSVLLIILLCVFYVLLVQVIIPAESRPSTQENLDLILKLTGALIVIFVIAMGIHSIIHSHRIAGPAYNIRRALESLAQGDLGVRVKLRDKDHLGDLAQSVNNLGERLGAREKALREVAAELLGLAEDPSLPADKREGLRRLAGRLAIDCRSSAEA